jgi:hypothetical protein
MKVICVGTKNFEKIDVIATDFSILKVYSVEVEQYTNGRWDYNDDISHDYQNDKIVYVNGYYFPQRIFDENFRIIPVKS